MWPMGVIIFLIIVAAFYIFSSHQNQIGWNNSTLRSNAKDLLFLIYRYLRRYGRLPKNNFDLQRLLPDNSGLMYFNPYSGEFFAYRDSPHQVSAEQAGDILYLHEPANDGVGESIFIFAFDGQGACLVKSRIVISATGEDEVV